MRCGSPQRFVALEQAHRHHDAASFAAAYRREAYGSGGEPGVQNCLGSPGVAPAASVATRDADVNRRRYVAAVADAPSI